MLRRKKVVFIGVLAILGIGAFGVLRQPEEQVKWNKGSSIQLEEFKPASGQYETKYLEDEEKYRGSLILVNNKVPYHFEEEDSLVSVYENKTKSYYVKDKNVTVAKQIIPNLNAMMDRFYKDTEAKEVNITSGFRSIERQKEIYSESVSKNGASYAKSYVANPGYSEHHSGLAMDLSLFNEKTKTSNTFDGKGELTWFRENAKNYGFILRYQKGKEGITGIKYESWHYRYVGVPHSYIMDDQGFCLEEYIDFIKQYSAKKKHLKVTVNGMQYEIYYVKGNKVSVPKDKTYTISGDNEDGFIVTVEYL